MYTAPIPIGFDDLRDGCSRSRWRSRSASCSSTGSRPSGAARCDLRAAPLLRARARSATMSFGLAGELAYSVIPVGWQLDNTTAAPGRHALRARRRRACSAASPRCTTGSRSSPGGCSARASARPRWRLILVGIHVYVLPMFLAGLEGQPVDVYKFFEGTGLDGYNLVASIGAFVLAVGVLLELGNAAHSWRNGRPRRATTRGAARRSSGSRSRPRRRTTSTPSPTCAAPSRCTTSASRSAAHREPGARRRPRGAEPPAARAEPAGGRARRASAEPEDPTTATPR